MKLKDMPEWVLKNKTKGTQIIFSNKSYYLYKITSKWDSKKQRSKKITEKYLGKITEEGLIPPKQDIVEQKYRHISIKEYGATNFLYENSQDIILNLKNIFPDNWKEIYIMALLRLSYKTHLKNLQFYYENSYISEIIKDAKLSQKSIGNFLRNLGTQRELIINYTNKFIVTGQTAVIDMTNIFSRSDSVVSAMIGHNKDKIYVPQINLILIYSLDEMSPVHFRMVPGSIRDISIITKTVDETQIKNIVLIGDKGFDSKDNIEKLKDSGVKYIISSKRGSSLNDYSKIGEKHKNAFTFDERIIWFYTTQNGEKEKIITYLDPYLKACEESDLMVRIKKLEEKLKAGKLKTEDSERINKYNKDILANNNQLGTLSIRTNVEANEEEIFQLLKSRMNIEQSFDTLKNNIEIERSYVRDDKQMEGWLFINFIALQLYYKLYAVLLKKKMLNNYSPVDVLTHLKRISVLKIKDEWQIAEIPKKTRETIKKLGLPQNILLKSCQVTV